MNQIVFDKSAVRVDISNKEVFNHTFRGYKLKDVDISILSHKVSCGCMTVTLPDSLTNEFEIKTHINKIGQSGFYVVSLYLEFSNGQKETLTLSGKII